MPAKPSHIERKKNCKPKLQQQFILGRAVRFGFVVLPLLAVLHTNRAQAQVLRDTQATPVPGDPSVQLGLIGTISSSIQLTVIGTGPTTLTNVTGGFDAPGAGTIDFGSFSTQDPSTATNANASRTTVGTPGAILVARMMAVIVYGGTASASIQLSRANLAGALPDVPLANLRVASPVLGTWNASTDGIQMPDAGAPGYDICLAQGAPTCFSGTAYDHQLAVFVPDTQPGGVFTTVVMYSGTAP